MPDGDDEEYFLQYGTMDAQMNMVCDFERTKRYQEAIQNQRDLLDGSTVMDVGSGTGILSVFCCRAGARRVYAVEASAAINIMQHLLTHNESFYRERIIGIHDKLENIRELPGSDSTYLLGCAGPQRCNEQDPGKNDRLAKVRESIERAACSATGSPRSPGATLEPRAVRPSTETEDNADPEPVEKPQVTVPEQLGAEQEAVCQSYLCGLASSQKADHSLNKARTCHATPVGQPVARVAEDVVDSRSPGRAKRETKPALPTTSIPAKCFTDQNKVSQDRNAARKSTGDEPVEEPVAGNVLCIGGSGIKAGGGKANGGKVDVIVSEPMGICLVSEGMMKTLLIARDRFLRPGGTMIPRKASIYVGLTSNSYYGLYISRESQLWRQKNMYGLDWRSLHSAAIQELLVRPVIMDVDDLVSESGLEWLDENAVTRPSSSSKPASSQLGKRRRMCAEPGGKTSGGDGCVSGGGWQDFRLKSESYQQGTYGSIHFDLLTCPTNSFDEIPISFPVGPLSNDVTLTAFVTWFDVELAPQVMLSTHPFAPRTHWHQTAFILERPILLEAGETLTATFHMSCRDRSYDCQGRLYKDDICVGKTLVCPLRYAVQV